jgi:hypothetical protein
LWKSGPESQKALPVQIKIPATGNEIFGLEIFFRRFSTNYNPSSGNKTNISSNFGHNLFTLRQSTL